MIIQASLINGVMLGIEFIWEDGVVVLDLFVVRLYFIKGAKDGE